MLVLPKPAILKMRRAVVLNLVCLNLKNKMSYLIAIFPVLLWAILKTFPPRRINNWYGYRTVTSKKSQQYWDEGNRYSTQFYLYIGLLALCTAFVANYLQFKNGVFLTAMVVATCMIVIIPITEKHLKKTFSIKK